MRYLPFAGANRMRKTKLDNKAGRRKGPTKTSLTALSARSQEARERALRALSSMRRGDSLSRAARENGVTARTVQRYVGGALVRNRRGGRIRATKSDRLTRYLQIPGNEGPKGVNVRDSSADS